MSAYAIFLGPIAAIMLFDFWVVHNRKYDTIALYNPHGIYRYTYGVNWRAIVAFLVGVAPSLPGTFLISSLTLLVLMAADTFPRFHQWNQPQR
jgi:cytosine/uracil/thiamine/allantoin permease